ncbi:MAG: S8 family serine peptidase [Bacillales bacterium]|jgi:subtilisin family serine protease|nr:S8 family serine peptidase [Bacillales bacterium]
MKNCIRFYLTFGLILGFGSLTGQSKSVYATNNFNETPIVRGPEQTETPRKITLEDDFSDQLVLIVLTREATLRFKQYTIKDFPELDNFQVEEITALSSQIVKAELESGIKTIKHMINIEEYKSILRITLNDKSKENVLNAIELLEVREDVQSAGPSFSGELASTPNDPKRSEQWGLNKIDAYKAWDNTVGINTSIVNVAVIDSGIQQNHPDLVNRISTIPSVDYTFGNNTSGDKNGHGTHVAGIIGAEGNNNIGVVGVGWNIKLVSIRVLNAFNGIDGDYTSCMIDALTYASNHDIPISNHSGSSSVATSLDSFETAIKNYAGLFVVSAGNNGINNDLGSIYPAKFQLPNLITVGAIDQYNNLSVFSATRSSNYGAKTVDIFAPGTDILSTYIDNNNNNINKYEELSGTSMAAPFVAGVAALILSINPSMKAHAIKSAIMDNSEKVSSLSGMCVSNGMLNANRAVKNAGVYTVSGDFDNDGKDDIAKFVDKGDGRTAIQVWKSTGSSFTYNGSVWSLSGYPVSAIATRVESGDFNNDGKTDIAAFYDYGNYSGGVNETRIYVWLSTGTGFTYTASGWWGSIGYTAGQITGRTVSGDFNGDGKDDLAAFYDYKGDNIRCHVWLSTGSSFTYQTDNGWWIGTQYRTENITNRVISGDFNNDGKDDIAAFYDYYESSSRIHVWLSTGSSFTYQGNNGWWVPSWYSAPNLSSRMVSGDFNNDGKTDIAAFYNYSATTTNQIRLHVWLSTGSSFSYQGDSGWFSHADYYSNAINGRVVSGKFNNDGRYDIAAIYDYGVNYTRIHTWLSTGSSFTYQTDNGWWQGDRPLSGYWQQPSFTSNTNANGTVTGTFSSPYDPYKAFDGDLPGTHNPYGEWAVSGTSGWLELSLNYNIVVKKIEFFNCTSSGSNRTKNAYFTGTGGIALGSSFTAVNANFGKSIISVNNIQTNKIKLNITTSYGSWVGASEIIVYGYIVV